LFNHESPRRGETFVTRKITRAVARIASQEQDFLFLGNLDAIRDWGYAPEFVEAMWLMLQKDVPGDYVISTGTSTSVREFVQYSFEAVGLDWNKFVKFDPRFERPTEVDSLIGDASKAKKLFGWEPNVQPRQLAELMVKHDLAALKSKSSFLVDSVKWRV
jgi:GDPmannose 4,6-dehydratase